MQSSWNPGSLSPAFGCLFLERRLLVPRLSQAWCRVSVNFLFLVTDGNRWDGDESQARQLQVLSL